LHWLEGYLTELSFTVQAAQGTGQVLCASIFCARQQCQRVGEAPFAPNFVRFLIFVASAGGWRPLELGLPPFQISTPYSDDLSALNHGWIFASQGPQTEGFWLTVVEDESAANRFGPLEARVHAAIVQALAGQTGTAGLPAPRKPVGIRLLCARQPATEGMRLLVQLQAVCASHCLALLVRTLEGGETILESGTARVK
jgi:hypothetical protein